MGNQVAAMIVQLGTHIEDPAERLRYVHSKTVNSKAMTEAIGARNMTEMSKVSPALFMALGAQLYTRLGLANRVAPPFSTVVTNVPGPPVPIHSAGARLDSMMGLVCLTDGMGLGHVVQSYVSEATIAFTADRDLMPDPDFYAQCIQDSFDELLAAAKAAPAVVAETEFQAEGAGSQAGSQLEWHKTGAGGFQTLRDRKTAAVPNLPRKPKCVGSRHKEKRMTAATMSAEQAPTPALGLLTLAEGAARAGRTRRVLCAAPDMNHLPRGDGHGVLVLPGFMASTPRPRRCARC